MHTVTVEWVVLKYKVRCVPLHSSTPPPSPPFFHLHIPTYPLPARYLAAGLFLAMLPAGEMWSVVTESPRFSNT